MEYAQTTQDAVAGMCNMALVQSGAEYATAKGASNRELKSDDGDSESWLIKVSQLLSYGPGPFTWEESRCLICKKLKQPLEDVSVVRGHSLLNSSCEWITGKSILQL